MSFAAAFLSFGAKKKQGVTPTSPLLIFLFLHFLYLLKTFSFLLEIFLFVFELDLFFLKHFGAKVQ